MDGLLSSQQQHGLFPDQTLPNTWAHSSGCLRSYVHNHFYQPKTLTASWDTKHIYLFAVVMSSARLNQAPVRHTPATSEAERRQREKRPFVSCVEFIISTLFPIFLRHFSISHFPFLSQITAINQVHV